MKLGEIIGFTIIHKGRTRTQTIVYQKINIFTKVTSVLSCGVLKTGRSLRLRPLDSKSIDFKSYPRVHVYMTETHFQA